jgi:hypothetical protein
MRKVEDSDTVTTNGAGKIAGRVDRRSPAHLQRGSLSPRKWSALALAFWLIGGAAHAQNLDTVPNFEAQGDFKAIARASGEVWGASGGYCSVTTAIEIALAGCNDALGDQGLDGVCRITRVGDINVSGLTGPLMTDSVERYRQDIEGGWLARSRQSASAIEFLAFGGDAEGWDQFIAGNVRFDPKALCLIYIDGSGPSIRCTGYSRFAGLLRDDSPFPSYAETVLTCTNGQDLKGESVSVAEGIGFSCFTTPSGGRVMVVYGPGSHALGRTRDAFLVTYNSLVAVSGLDRELCGWGLLIS